MEADYGFLDGFLGGANGAEAEWVDASVDLLDELQSFEVEYEDLVLEHDHQDLLPQLYVLDVAVRTERNLSSVLLLVVVPNHYLILLF